MPDHNEIEVETEALIDKPEGGPLSPGDEGRTGTVIVESDHQARESDDERPEPTGR